jgi:NAD(P)-dependent dehydrogenase (short-subunit alcohol dehydrogenase family)
MQDRRMDLRPPCREQRIREVAGHAVALVSRCPHTVEVVIVVPARYLSVGAKIASVGDARRAAGDADRGERRRCDEECSARRLAVTHGSESTMRSSGGLLCRSGVIVDIDTSSVIAPGATIGRGTNMAGLVEGRVAIVTGAGRGIGREHALSLARHGAKVVVNDLGGEMDGSGGDLSPAQEVVNEIIGMGGEAVANGDNVADWEGAQRLINTAIETFGDLHAVVNNAGILRDRVLANMTEQEWDAVINVHLKGTFAPSRWAVAYWRERSKAGEPVSGRIVNTTSVSGIYGNAGQSNYGAAKAGIAAFTNIVALEVARYGVTVNAVGPVALTRMTEGLGPAPENDEAREARAPHWIAPIVTWLCSEEAAGVTGRVFEASGQTLAVAEGWVRGPSTAPIDDPTQLGPVVADLLAKARPNSGMDGTPGSWPQTTLKS